MQNPEFKIIRSGRKTIALEVTSSLSLVVRAPYGLKEEFIRVLIDKSRPWIDRKLKFMRDRNIQSPRKGFLDGENFLYLGKSHRLNILGGLNPPLIFKDAFFLNSEYNDSARQLFTNWYKDSAQRKILERVELYSGVSGLKYGKVNITNARHRWGSCGRRNSLNFSWRLIMAPLEIIDYVVVHEIAHLAVKDHSKRFWQKVSQLFPDYKKCRKWLRGNGYLLNI